MASFMIKLITSGEILLASRPKGLRTATNFNLAEMKFPPLQDGHVLVIDLS